MNDTLPTSNKVNIILIIVFILFLIGIVGYLTYRQFSNTAGEFPNVSADSLVASNASITLSGPDTISDSGSDYDVILDTKGEVVSSINIDLAIPTKDVSISVSKGTISAFSGGTFSSNSNSASNTAKIQMGTNTNQTFNGTGTLAKITLKRLSTSSGSSVAISLLKTSYLKLTGYSPKGFTTASTKTYSYVINGSTIPISTSSSSVSTTTVATQTITSTATATPVVASSSSQTATPMVDGGSSSTATAIVTSQSTATSTQLATTKTATPTTTSTTIATTISSSKSTTSSLASSSTGNLPATSVDDPSTGFLYLAFASLIVGFTILIASKRNSLQLFEKSFEK